MMNTINPTTVHKPLTIRKKIVSYSGYAAIAAGTLCGVTGFRQVKIPNKMKVHKYSAYFAAISTLLHWGAAKGWDRKLFNKH